MPLTPTLSPKRGEGARPAPVLSVRNLRTEVATPEGSRAVVEDLSFDLASGETL